jgi:hypothetical protein
LSAVEESTIDTGFASLSADDIRIFALCAYGSFACIAFVDSGGALLALSRAFFVIL